MNESGRKRPPTFGGSLSPPRSGAAPGGLRGCGTGQGGSGRAGSFLESRVREVLLLISLLLLNHALPFCLGSFSPEGYPLLKVRPSAKLPGRERLNAALLGASPSPDGSRTAPSPHLRTTFPFRVGPGAAAEPVAVPFPNTPETNRSQEEGRRRAAFSRPRPGLRVAAVAPRCYPRLFPTRGPGRGQQPRVAAPCLRAAGCCPPAARSPAQTPPQQRAINPHPQRGLGQLLGLEEGEDGHGLRLPQRSGGRARPRHPPAETEGEQKGRPGSGLSPRRGSAEPPRAAQRVARPGELPAGPCPPSRASGHRLSLYSSERGEERVLFLPTSDRTAVSEPSSLRTP